MKKIGLIGGVSWTSTIDYYRLINQEVNERLGGLNSAEIIIYSLNFADVQEVGWENAFNLLIDAANKLKQSGVEAIALCANTAHLFADKLKKKVELPIISIVDATANEVQEKGIKKVALLGTKYTMELDFYRKRLESFDIEVFIPKKKETRNEIQRIVKDELGKGIVKSKSKETLISNINTLVNNEARGVILGCTELPLLIEQEDVSIPIFDTTKIHSNAIVNYILN